MKIIKKCFKNKLVKNENENNQKRDENKVKKK